VIITPIGLAVVGALLLPVALRRRTNQTTDQPGNEPAA
jgi:hypothetical protein